MSNNNAKERYDSQNSRFWVKDMRIRTRTTVILASRATPPLAAGSQKCSNIVNDITVTMIVRIPAYLC